MRQLLVLQLELFELMEPALRASCVFLAEVSLAKSKQGIAAPTLEAIDAVRTALCIYMYMYWYWYCRVSRTYTAPQYLPCIVVQ